MTRYHGTDARDGGERLSQKEFVEQDVRERRCTRVPWTSCERHVAAVRCNWPLGSRGAKTVQGGVSPTSSCSQAQQDQAASMRRQAIVFTVILGLERCQGDLATRELLRIVAVDSHHSTVS